MLAVVEFQAFWGQYSLLYSLYYAYAQVLLLSLLLVLLFLLLLGLPFLILASNLHVLINIVGKVHIGLEGLSWRNIIDISLHDINDGQVELLR